MKLFIFVTEKRKRESDFFLIVRFFILVVELSQNQELRLTGYNLQLPHNLQLILKHNQVKLVFAVFLSAYLYQYSMKLY